MRIHTLHREQRLDGTPDEVFPFFADAFNLEALTPPLLRFRVVTPRPIDLYAGALIQYALKLRGVPISWLTSIQRWDPPHAFVDTQIKGPYALWHHTHTFEPDDSDPTRPGTIMTDTVRYGIAFGPLGELANKLMVRRDVEAIFDYRAAEIPRLLAEFRARQPAAA